MTPNSETPSVDAPFSEIDKMTESTRNIESDVATFLKEFSTDVLSSTSRSNADKCITFSVISMLSTTFGEVRLTFTNVGLMVDLKNILVLNTIILSSSIYYAVGMVVMATSDYRRFRAAFDMRVAELMFRAAEINDAVAQLLVDQRAILDREVKGWLSSLGRLDTSLPQGEESPPKVHDYSEEVERRAELLGKRIDSIINAAYFARRQFRYQLITFVGAPACLALCSLLLFILNAIDTL